VLSSFASYAVEKKFAKHPEEFGKGAIEGVAGPETANNSATAGCFVPFLSLGIPSNGTMALMLGALMVHGVVPGPLLIQDHPDVFWGVIASMYLANMMLVVLNLPLIGIWVKILKVPYQILFPLILLFCLLGTYTISYSVFDIYVLIFFSVAGYFLRKVEFPVAPIILARVLEPMMEKAFFQTMVISDGHMSIFLSRPFSAGLIVLGMFLVGHTIYRHFRSANKNQSNGDS
jgi:putative tricarboxylic transport membrane protein